VQQTNANTKLGRHHGIGVLFLAVASFWWDNVVLIHACAQQMKRKANFDTIFVLFDFYAPASEKHIFDSFDDFGIHNAGGVAFANEGCVPCHNTTPIWAPEENKLAEREAPFQRLTCYRPRFHGAA
jgi:hypothetical protein